MAETTTPTTERLPVKLNADEIELNARALGLAHSRKKEIEDELSFQKSAAKQKIESLDNEIGSRSRVAVSGEEERSVPVEYRKNYQRSLVETWRLDTMKFVGSRPMNPSERQQGLFEEREADEDERVGLTPEGKLVVEKLAAKADAKGKKKPAAKPATPPAF